MIIHTCVLFHGPSIYLNFQNYSCTDGALFDRIIDMSKKARPFYEFAIQIGKAFQHLIKNFLKGVMALIPLKVFRKTGMMRKQVLILVMETFPKLKGESSLLVSLKTHSLRFSQSQGQWLP